MTLSITQFFGNEIEKIISELASIRIRVFKEYPYLYDGDIAYEEKYLQDYSRHSSALCIAVYKNNNLVGASTGMLLKHAAMEFQAPFVSAQLNTDDYFYFGESVLLPDYRGQGVGKKFFHLREAHAKQLGAPICTFCAVDRPDNHPQKPEHYQTLNAFWQAMGYQQKKNLRAEFSWKEIGNQQQSLHTLSYWLKNIR